MAQKEREDATNAGRTLRGEGERESERMNETDSAD